MLKCAVHLLLRFGDDPILLVVDDGVADSKVTHLLLIPVDSQYGAAGLHGLVCQLGGSVRVVSDLGLNWLYSFPVLKSGCELTQPSWLGVEEKLHGLVDLHCSRVSLKIDDPHQLGVGDSDREGALGNWNIGPQDVKVHDSTHLGCVGESEDAGELFLDGEGDLVTILIVGVNEELAWASLCGVNVEVCLLA